MRGINVEWVRRRRRRRRRRVRWRMRRRMRRSSEAEAIRRRGEGRGCGCPYTAEAEAVRLSIRLRRRAGGPGVLACLGLQSTGGRRRLVQVPGVHELAHFHLKDTHFRGGCSACLSQSRFRQDSSVWCWSCLSPDPPLTHPCDRGHPASPGGQAGKQGGRWRDFRGHLAALLRAGHAGRPRRAAGPEGAHLTPRI